MYLVFLRENLDKTSCSPNIGMKRSLISKHEWKVNWAITTFKTHLISASIEDKGTLRFSRVVFLLFDAFSLAVDFVTII